MSTWDDVQRRVEDLEVRYAFQEDALRQLDEVVRAQADLIERLTAELRALREEQAKNAPPEAPPEEQVPPHY